MLKILTLPLLTAISISWLIYYASMSVGYGSDGTTLNAIFRRSVYGLLVGASPILIAWHMNMWGLYFFGVCISLVTSVTLGVWNSPKIEVYEEALICIGSFAVALFLI